MNFANIRESSVRSVEARCEARGHEAVVNCDALLADLPVSTYRSTAALAVIWTGGAVADLYSPLSTMQNWIIFLFFACPTRIRVSRRSQELSHKTVVQQS